MGAELAELVRRHGGLVRSTPAVHEAPLESGATIVSQFLDRLHTPARRVYVFLTGAGAAALFQEAERQGQLAFIVESVNRGTVICRGPKPAAALRRYGVSPSASAASPYTSHQLLEAMAAIDLGGIEVTVVHYGERNDELSDQLRARCAALNELCLYEWRLPDDVSLLQELTRGLVRREVDAIIFTSQVQWKHLLRIATALGLSDAVIRALNDNITVAAVGPVCAAALAASGVRAAVVPENPKMGPLVTALAEHFGG